MGNTKLKISEALDRLPSVSTFTWNSTTDTAILSPEAQALLGVTSPVSTNNFFAHVHPDDRLRFEAETTAYLESGGTNTREFRVVHRDGTLRHVIKHSSLNHSERDGRAVITGIFIDVTEARTARNADHTSSRDHFGFYDLDVGRGMTELSPALRNMVGVPTLGPVTAENVRDFVHPDDREWATARMREAMSQPGPYEFSYRIVLLDGRILTVRDKGEAHAPLDPIKKTVARITGSMTNITNVIKESDARRLANDKFWRMIDVAPFGAYIVDADLRMVRISEGGKAAFAEIDGLIGRDLDEVLHILWPAHFASEAVARFRHTLATGEPHHADPVIEERADRHVLEAYDWSIERIELDDGEPGVLCYFYDLSERVRNERELEQARDREHDLMGEINHRTKNVLTLVQVLARQTARGGSQDFIARFLERIDALAKAQDLMFQNSADRVDLRELVESQLGHFLNTEQPRISLSGPSVRLGPRAAQAVGMALHELATNASKYGALSSDEGKIEIAWELRDDESMFIIEWAEHDGPPVVQPEGKGFGSTVINQITEAAMNADVQLDFAPEGVKWQLTCRIEALSTAI